MKPQRFTPGQEVVVLPLKITKVVDQGLPVPKTNELVIIDKYLYYSYAFRVWIVQIAGYPRQDFGENIFGPVMSTEALEEELSTITERATA
jgi:hypothetical protein